MNPIRPATYQWGSVRKVRYLDEIFALVRFANEHDGKAFDLEIFTRLLKSIRARREALRVQLFQGGTRKALRSLGDPGAKTYSFIASDVLSFAKGLGILQLKGSQVFCPTEVRHLAELLDQNLGEAKRRIIALILDSKYRAYQLLLGRLQELEGTLRLSISDGSSSRGASLRIFLEGQGIMTDPASFYTMRDLLYNLELLNWRVDPSSKSEEVFMTSAFVGQNEIVRRVFQDEIELQRSRLHFRPMIAAEDFARSLLDSYLLITHRQMGPLAQILDAREMVCVELRISDQQFSDLLSQLYREPSRLFRLELSEGTIPYRGGLLIKALTLPSIREGSLLTYFRLRRPPT